ncbi:MAG: membrane protein insertase YidC [Lysobacteraceae bacterium]|nr:MAG: membrane protein insertase YidC [Xanthomonadaceae bacterium]
MNQTRTFLIFAWLMVAALLFMEWGKEKQSAEQIATTPAPTAAQTNTIPAAQGQIAAMTTTAQVATAPSAATYVLSNDVLRLTLDGGSIRRAELLAYRQSRDPGAPLVRLLDDAPASFYIARSGWTSAQGAPGAEGGFVAENPASEHTLTDGADQVSARFVWTGADGVTIRRTFTLKRGDYALHVRDEVSNGGSAPWTGHIDRQLARVPPQIKRGFTNPESFSFNGAAWYTPEKKYDKRNYEEFAEDGPLNITAAGGWVALLQHYFFTGWIPQADQQANYALSVSDKHYGISATGPQFTVPPGGRARSEAQLWIGPKLQGRLEKTAPGLNRTLDYGVFTIIAEPIHWLLAQLHKITRNWGWAIVLLVVLIKLALYPLSAAQYKSMAKMRKFQPRVQQLKERYGDDKEKFQMAYLELIKKEKLNPAGGCLPLLIQMPVFLALYWVLLESVELRQAPWTLWIQDMTSRDPYFILPAINMAVMWLTQKMTPMVGVDPIQQKMFQFMPLIFGVMFAVFPAGLVLYWVTNGSLSMLQQWWMMRQYGDKATAAKA